MVRSVWVNWNGQQQQHQTWDPDAYIPAAQHRQPQQPPSAVSNTNNATAAAAPSLPQGIINNQRNGQQQQQTWNPSATIHAAPCRQPQQKTSAVSKNVAAAAVRSLPQGTISDQRNDQQQQHQTWDPGANMSVAPPYHQPQHQPSAVSNNVCAAAAAPSFAQGIIHNRSDSELVQHYTALYRAWNERALQAAAALQALHSRSGHQREEMGRREQWARHYAANSSALAHHHLALSRGEQPCRARPDSPPVIAPSFAPSFAGGNAAAATSTAPSAPAVSTTAGNCSPSAAGYGDALDSGVSPALPRGPSCLDHPARPNPVHALKSPVANGGVEGAATVAAAPTEPRKGAATETVSKVTSSRATNSITGKKMSRWGPIVANKDVSNYSRTTLPTREIPHLRVNGVGNRKHKANYQQRAAPPPQWTLVIDTCCLINDKGAEANRLIKLSTQQNQQNGTALESTDMVIPYKVWAELEYQSKSGDGNVAFAARAVIRMLRAALEANVAANDIDRNNSNVLRSQTILESREAAAKFLPQGFPQSTNDDHILACALLENERAHCKSTALRKVEVVLITHDNNLACKAYSNGLKVHSFSRFQEKCQSKSLEQRHEVPVRTLISCGNTGTAPEEVIEILSDSSDDEIEVIDLTNTSPKRPGYVTIQ